MNFERYIEFYNRLGIKTKLLDKILWREYQRMVIPVGPIKFDYLIKKDEAQFLLSEFPKAVMVRFTFNFDVSQNTEWYAVICDKFLELSEIASANTRSKIRRGLKNCKVELVDADFIARQGYEVYISAFKRYKDVKPIREKEFIRSVLVSRDFNDIIHYWGVFERNSKRLIAYSQNFIFGEIEVNYSTIKFHPDYLKLYPSYALIYTMNKYYLKEKPYEYVNDGFRSIFHETSFQEYLIKKFNFRKAYTRLEVIYRPWLFAFLSITFPFRKFLGKINAKLKALYEMEEIRRLSNNVKQ